MWSSGGVGCFTDNSLKVASQTGAGVSPEHSILAAALKFPSSIFAETAALMVCSLFTAVLLGRPQVSLSGENNFSASEGQLLRKSPTLFLMVADKL